MTMPSRYVIETQLPGGRKVTIPLPDGFLNQVVADGLRDAADALDRSETLRSETDDHMHDINLATAELRRIAESISPQGEQ